MNAYVEECRREWKRLEVPDLLAEEMSAELEADLAEAEADGVSAAEMLGESDPRRFAFTWAKERGLVSEPGPKKSRKRLWIWVAVGLVVLFVLPGILAGLALTTSSASISTTKSPQPVRSVVIPNFVGLRACHAERIAHESGLRVQPVPRRRCNTRVVAQRPLRGTLLEWPRRAHTTVILRLRG